MEELLRDMAERVKLVHGLLNAVVFKGDLSVGDTDVMYLCMRLLEPEPTDPPMEKVKELAKMQVDVYLGELLGTIDGVVK